MTDQNQANNIAPPSGPKLLKATALTIIGALLVLVLVVLPAEYGVDLTGFGAATGLNDMSGEATVTIEVTDIFAGNEVLREVEVPDFGAPTPLPNPTVFQDQPSAAETMTMTVELGAFEQTEIKTHLLQGKVIVYSWEVVGDGIVYVDFHGHDVSFGPDFFVRYKEQQEGRGNNGSLTAPFTGEHGWFWLNINEFPITIELTVTGFYDEIIDYGIF